MTKPPPNPTSGCTNSVRIILIFKFRLLTNPHGISTTTGVLTDVVPQPITVAGGRVSRFASPLHQPPVAIA
jgi:hypothetical protein